MVLTMVGLVGSGLGVDDVDARRAQTGDDEGSGAAPRSRGRCSCPEWPWTRRGRGTRCRRSQPKWWSSSSGMRHVDPAHDPAVGRATGDRCRGRTMASGLASPSGPGVFRRGDVGETLRRCGRRRLRRTIEGRVGHFRSFQPIRTLKIGYSCGTIVATRGAERSGSSG